MKKFLSIVLSLIIISGTLPLNGQEAIAPVISREDLEDYDKIHATTNKELNKITIDNPEEVHK